MNTQALREKTVDQLKEQLLECLRERANLRLQQIDTESAAKPHQFKRVAKDIARIKTILCQKGERL